MVCNHRYLSAGISICKEYYSITSSSCNFGISLDEFNPMPCCKRGLPNTLRENVHSKEIARLCCCMETTSKVKNTEGVYFA